MSFFWITPLAIGGEHDYPISAVPLKAVRVSDEFWAPRLEVNRTVCIPHNFRECERTGRISNFEKAAHRIPGEREGYFFNDSDVYKALEAAAYALASHPDPELDRRLDDLIGKIAAAQEFDGYLYTARTINPNDPPLAAGRDRWMNLQQSHELYCVGHLYEAAVAHYQATGKRSLLDVALKSAQLVRRDFGPSARRDVPGHEEVELALVKLHRLTDDSGLLDLARFFLEQRGNRDGHVLYGEYAQDHKPVIEQDEPVGHAVRAAYLYCGMTDIAALTGDQRYEHALDRIWRSMVASRLYITGGIGARHEGEAFGGPYELPNESAYAETCAGIANLLWNQRMFLLHGDAKYIDVLERALYNGVLSGVSLSGDRFFYVNPLASQGDAQRQAWFDCACCPPNIARTVASLPSLIYAQRADGVYVNLFIASKAEIKLGEKVIKIEQETRYPWEGDVKIRVAMKQPMTFTIFVRVPGWSRGEPLPSDLYRDLSPVRYVSALSEVPSLRVAGELVEITPRDGYAAVQRTWSDGDTIELHLPMPVRRVIAHPKVEADRDRVALERGPIVYCVEGVDNDGLTRDLILPDDCALHTQFEPDLLGGVVVIRGAAQRLRRADDSGRVETVAAQLVAVPYCVWSNRGAGEMTVWLPRSESGARARPFPTVASRSRVSSSFQIRDVLQAINDQIEPQNSKDHGVPRMTWWDHRGTLEWVQYDFAAPTRVSSVAVYWFDDTGIGACRVPASWRVLYRDGEQWRPVSGAGECGTKLDQFNEAAFDPVETSALRLEVQLQDKFSGGILEWRVR